MSRTEAGMAKCGTVFELIAWDAAIDCHSKTYPNERFGDTASAYFQKWDETDKPPCCLGIPNHRE